MAKPYTEIADLNDRAFRNGLRMADVLERAGVSWATWWRARRGGNPRLSTLNRIRQAMDEMIRDQETTNGESSRDE